MYSSGVMSSMPSMSYVFFTPTGTPYMAWRRSFSSSMELISSSSSISTEESSSWYAISRTTPSVPVTFCIVGDAVAGADPGGGAIERGAAAAAAAVAADILANPVLLESAHFLQKAQMQRQAELQRDAQQARPGAPDSGAWQQGYGADEAGAPAAARVAAAEAELA
eukprot:CAMPEP_0184258088 /NCGR_PEP_ID=MMETSP0977-20130417/9796_1 /TAXON_ID=483370 /ORGANISM="non described non described, Strain CCMP2097" /LENGTH=165 /DNA_ID=CAMNT_0026563705 /DNA_START=147 /DNA_END=641 /DNA_ORIENTATION=-